MYRGNCSHPDPLEGRRCPPGLSSAAHPTDQRGRSNGTMSSGPMAGDAHLDTAAATLRDILTAAKPEYRWDVEVLPRPDDLSDEGSFGRAGPDAARARGRWRPPLREQRGLRRRPLHVGGMATWEP